LHRLRTYAGFAAGLLICTALAWSPPLQWSSAHAQKTIQLEKPKSNKAARKKETRKKETRDARKDKERVPFTEQDEQAAIVAGIPDARAWGDSEQEFSRLLPQASGPWLAISGGGSDGAFGGGVLAGWSETGARPQFAVVTGASIGSLLAPFAFLGSRHDEEVRNTFTSISAADIFEDRKTRDSLFDSWPLRRQIELRVTRQLLSNIAAEHARGRRLFVATTNLDAGRRVVWNMGAIAARGDDRALKLFHDILLASCSIPGFFSPVGIEVEAHGRKFEEMHSDGTLTAPFFVVPESMLSASGTAPPPLGQLYLLVNSKLSPDFSMTDPSIAGVLSRSITAALKSAMRAGIMLISAGAQRHGFGLRIAHVDDGFNHPHRGVFDGAYMRALYDYGVAAGRKGNAFEDVTLLSLRGSSSAQ
jgi:hypothetical protein